MENTYNTINATSALDQVQILRKATHLEAAQKKEISSQLGSIEMDIIEGRKTSGLDFNALYGQLEICDSPQRQVGVLASCCSVTMSYPNPLLVC